MLIFFIACVRSSCFNSKKRDFVVTNKDGSY
jgi:hypothetical protein